MHNMTRQDVTSLYFKFITFLLHLTAAFPEEKVSGGELNTFLLYKVWPVVFILIWVPAILMITRKIAQFISNAMWDDLLEIMHMFILSCNTLYYAGAFQKAAKDYQSAMDLVNNHFKTAHFLRLQRETWMHVLISILALCFCMCLGANFYYGENLVPLWIPFLDNEKPLPLGPFLFVWFYEGLAGCYMVLFYGILAPFVIVMTTMIRNEMFYGIRQLERFRYFRGQAEVATWIDINKNCTCFEKSELGKANEKFIDENEPFNAECFNELDAKRFIRALVQHHHHILRTIDAVGKIHNFIFFSQAFFTITHSCFLAFSFYYTNHLIKMALKYTPILAVSYYFLFMYCWNGQRLTDTCEELHRALFRCRWIGAPRSFKSSLMIITEYSKRPVLLTGGGVFSASLHTFLQGVQQSLSYILILKAMMAPGRN